jgi:molybdopterin-guanine dinucleotide biosynthesis protein MobB
MMAPAVVALVGKKKSGKTTVSVKLIEELDRRGYRVMTIKHGHHFDVDTPGTDSWRHRHEGGSERTVLAGPDGFAVVGSWPREQQMGVVELVRRFLSDADIVVVEGFKSEPVPKIEIFRKAAHAEPVFAPDSCRDSVLGVVTDDALRYQGAGVPILDIEAPEVGSRLADLVEDRVMAFRKLGVSVA